MWWTRAKNRDYNLPLLGIMILLLLVFLVYIILPINCLRRYKPISKSPIFVSTLIVVIIIRFERRIFDIRIKILIILAFRTITERLFTTNG